MGEGEAGKGKIRSVSHKLDPSFRVTNGWEWIQNLCRRIDMLNLPMLKVPMFTWSDVGIGWTLDVKMKTYVILSYNNNNKTRIPTTQKQAFAIVTMPCMTSIMTVMLHVMPVTTKTETSEIDPTKLTTSYTPTVAKDNVMTDKKIKHLLHFVALLAEI